MLRNNVYNMMNQMVQESKSIWRIKNYYEKEAVGSDDVMNLWKKIEKQKEENIAEFQALIEKHGK